MLGLRLRHSVLSIVLVVTSGCGGGTATLTESNQLSQLDPTLEDEGKVDGTADPEDENANEEASDATSSQSSSKVADVVSSNASSSKSSSATPSPSPGPDLTPPTVSLGFLTLDAVEIDDESVNITWVAAVDNETSQSQLSYAIYYSETANLASLANIKNNGTKAGEILGATAFEVTGLIIDKDYYFNVIVSDAEGNETAYTQRKPFCAGSGMTGDEFEICDGGSLQFVQLHLDAEFVVSKDIDLTGSKDWNSGSGFYPIGEYSSSPFTGIFDGQDFEISGLYIQRAGNQGMFGYISGSGTSVKNFSLAYVYVSSSDATAGGLTPALADLASVSKVHVSGIVHGISIVGGLVAEVTLNATIEQCSTSGNISLDAASLPAVAGGLVGRIYNTIAPNVEIKSSYSASNVVGIGPASAGTQGVGGFVGYSSGSAVAISDSFATGHVHGYGIDAGGFVGQLLDGDIYTSYASGNVFTDYSFAGGFAGYAASGIQSVFSAGAVSGGVGGLIGNAVAPETSISNSFYFYSHTSYSHANCYSGGSSNCSSKTDVRWFYDIDSFGGGNGFLDWDFTAAGAWIMPQTGKFPVLQWQEPNDAIGFAPEFRNGRKIGFSDQATYRVWGYCSQPDATITFSGTSNNPASTTCNGGTWESTWDFSTASEGNLTISMQQGTEPAVSRTLEKDTVSCDGVNQETSSVDIDTRFGASSGPHIICNVAQMSRLQANNVNYSKHFILGNNIDLSTHAGTPIGYPVTTAHYFTGIFDGDGFVLSNLTINNTLYNSGLFGYVRDPGEIKNFGIENMSTVVANGPFGGIVGDTNSSRPLSHVYTTGFLRANSDADYGGICGQCKTIENSFSTVDIVNDDSMVGGLGGQVQSIINSFSTGNIIGRYYVGGLAGYVYGEIDRSYSTGTVSGFKGSTPGAIVGGLAASINGNVSDSFARGSVYNDRLNGSAGGLVGQYYAAGETALSNSYASASVFGGFSAGGLVGSVVNFGNPSIDSSFAANVPMTFSDSANVGAVVGAASASLTVTSSLGLDAGDLECIGTLNGATSIDCDTVDSSAFSDPNFIFYESWDTTTPMWIFPEEGSLPILQAN